MPKSMNMSTWMKAVQALLLAVAVCFWTGAASDSARFNDLGHRLMCTCGCAQLLGECNHVGCTESGRERNELSAAIASGATDQQILNSFAAKYGMTVLAAPQPRSFQATSAAPAESYPAEPRQTPQMEPPMPQG